MIKRRFISSALLSAAMFALAPCGWAQDKAVHIVVPASAGGPLDAAARILAERVSAISGEPFVVDNRPGANSTIGIDYVIRSPADGRTLLFTGASLVIGPMMQKLPMRPVEDLRPVIAVTREHYALWARAGLGAQSARDLSALSASRPGGLNCAAPPGPMFLACEQLRLHLQGATTTVPYAGVAPALTALGGGHVDVVFIPFESGIPLRDAGQARLLASNDRAHAQEYGVPVIADVWPEFELQSTQGMLVPAATPDARVRQLNAWFAKALSEPATRERLRGAAAEPLPPSSPEEFGRVVADMQTRYARVAEKVHFGRQ